MRSELLLYIIVASLFGYFLQGYVKKSEGEGDKSVFGHKASIQKDAKAHREDNIGQDVLDFAVISQEGQAGIWKRSPLHQEFMDILPNFMAMRDFVHDRIIGESFQQRLLQQINATEYDFFSGKTTQREAKEQLDAL